MTQRFIIERLTEHRLARFDAHSTAELAEAEMDRSYPTWRRYAGAMADEADNVKTKHRGFEFYEALLHQVMLTRLTATEQKAPHWLGGCGH